MVQALHSIAELHRKCKMQAAYEHTLVTAPKTLPRLLHGQRVLLGGGALSLLADGPLLRGDLLESGLKF